MMTIDYVKFDDSICANVTSSLLWDLKEKKMINPFGHYIANHHSMSMFS